MSVNVNSTPLGTYLRILRSKHSETQTMMASRLGIKPQFLSRIELGKRNIPDYLIQTVIERYSLSKKDTEKLYKAMQETYPDKTIAFDKCTTPEKAKLITTLKSTIDSLTDEDCNTMTTFIERTLQKRSKANAR